MENQLFKNKFRIKSTRLPNRDYSSNGAYYVTICTKNRECFLGEIINEKMVLSEIGRIVHKFWYEIPQYFGNVILDEFIIMPDHVHGILIICNKPCRDGVTPSLQYRQRPTLGQIVGYFKYQSTKSINEFRNMPGVSIWQTRFHEHIIRNEHELNIKRKYIINNPLNWEFDRNNPNKRKI